MTSPQPTQADPLAPAGEPWLLARCMEVRDHDPGALGTSLVWLRTQLAAHRRPVVDGSALDLAIRRCITLRTYLEARQGPTYTLRHQLRFFSEAYGIDFMSKAIHAAVLAGLHVPSALWRALGDPQADVIITRAGKPSQSRDLVWELVLGALCKRVASSVVFDEPDVRCEFRGNTIAIAAKVAYGKRNIWTNGVEKGMSQANGRGAVGLVAVNATNIAPLHLWLRQCERRGFREGPRPSEWASLRAAVWCDRVLQVEPAMINLAKVPTMPTGVMLFVPIVLTVEGSPGMFFYLHIPASWQGEHGPDAEFVFALCEGSKTVLDRVDGQTPCFPAAAPNSPTSAVFRTPTP